MRRFTLVGLAVAGIMAAAVFLGTSVLGPSGDTAHADGAIVDKDFSCFLPASASGLGVDLWTTDSHQLLTPSGNTTLTCHFDIPAGEEPAKAIQNSGFLCNTIGGITDHSRSVATPGGKALLVCQIKA